MSNSSRKPLSLQRFFAPLLTNNAPRVSNTYDYMGRRCVKTVHRYDVLTATWNHTETRTFTYEGWRWIEETIQKPGQPNEIQYHTWGLDLSLTIGGAGDTGGIIATTVNQQDATPPHLFYHYDANGNLTQLISPAGVVASYQYTPSGSVIHSSGWLAAANTIRFSTRYMDRETELMDYGYRFYSIKKGRWLRKDPANESGGINTYSFVRNSPLNLVDIRGLNPNKKPRGGWIGGKWNPFTHLGNLGDWARAESQGIPVLDSVCAIAGGAFQLVGDVGSLDVPGALERPFEAVGSAVAMAGEHLDETNLPIISQVGNTIESGGSFAEDVGGIVHGVSTLNGNQITSSAASAVEHASEVAGVGHLHEYAVGNTIKPIRRQDPRTGEVLETNWLTGTVPVPKSVAPCIQRANRRKATFTLVIKNDEEGRGMKRWHMYSNALVTSEAGITEIPAIILGGILHEVEPGGFATEVYHQGLAQNVLIDIPGDLTANLAGVLAGLFLPPSALDEATDLVAPLIPGMYNPPLDGSPPIFPPSTILPPTIHSTP